MKVAKIITTSFVSRVIREETILAGSPLGYFSHSQNFPTPNSIIDLIDLNIKLENNCNPGTSVDLIIVNNDTGYTDGNHYLNNLNNFKIKNGVIKILNRNNYGRSFGGYNDAYKKYKNLYDYFIFTEDDVIIAKNNYAINAINHFNKIKDCGFVAYLGISKEFLNHSVDEALHAHGGMGLTSVKVLNELEKKFGNLPFANQNMSQDYLSIIKYGEIAFTNSIHKIGYKLTEIEKNIKFYYIAYDYMRNYDLPRYPNFFDVTKFKIKEKIFNIIN